MKFLQALPFIGLATAAVQDSPLARRQVDVVKGVFEKVQSDTAAVGSAAKSFSGDPGPLTTASNTLLADLKSGASTIAGSSEVDITGATQIAQFVTGLQSTVQDTVKAVIAIKSQVSAAGFGGTVYDSLVQQKEAAGALADATTKKTPAALQSVAQQLSAGIISALDEGVNAYKEFQGQTAPAAGGSAPPPAAGGAAPPPAASAPSAPTASEAAPAAPAAPLASTPPKTGGVSSGSTPPECNPAPSKTPVKPTTSPTPTKPASPPAQFTGAAGTTNPYMGFALAAAGLVAAL